MSMSESYLAGKLVEKDERIAELEKQVSELQDHNCIDAVRSAGYTVYVPTPQPLCSG